MIYNLTDLVLIKDSSLKREDVQKTLSIVTDAIKENLFEGRVVHWDGLCTFTWKKKATTKKAAKEWTEYPYLAEGEKVRVVPEDGVEMNAKGGVAKAKREVKVE